MRLQDKGAEIRHYDGDATAAAEAMAKWRAVFSAGLASLREQVPSFLQRVRPHLDPDSAARVLDVGCGPGFLLLALEERTAWRGVGVDLSHASLVSGREARATRRSATSLVRADAEHLPFRSDSFDAVVMFNALHHFPSFHEVFRSTARVLRPSGVLVVEDGNLLFPRTAARAVLKRIRGQPWGSPNEWPYSLFRFRRAACRAGMVVEDLRAVRYIPSRIASAHPTWDELPSRIPPLSLLGSRVFGVARVGSP